MTKVLIENLYLKSQQPYTQLLLRAASKPAQKEIDEIHVIASGQKSCVRIKAVITSKKSNLVIDSKSKGHCNKTTSFMRSKQVTTSLKSRSLAEPKYETTIKV